MNADRIILTGFLVFIFASCMARPVLTGKDANMLREISSHAPVVNRVDISPDGRYILSGSYDSVVLWDIVHGVKIQTFHHNKAFTGFTTAVAFSPDGKYFASGGAGIKLWDLTTRQEVMTFDDEGMVSSLTFSPDGKHILCGGIAGDSLDAESSNMKIFDVGSGDDVKEFKLPNTVWSPAYSPDGRYVLSGCDQGKVYLWNMATARAKKTAQASTAFVGSVFSVAYSPNGQYALTGGSDNSVRLWDAKRMKEIRQFTGHEGVGGVWSVSFSPDGKYAVSAGFDSRILIWDLESGALSKILSGHSGRMGTSAKFFPNGKHLASAGDASTRIWNASTGEEVASLIAFEDGEWIITTANGYYNCSPKGDQYFNIKIGGKDYSIEQLRESFYRPDLVQLSLEGGSLKELKKAADIQPPPVVSIVDTPKTTRQSDAEITLQIEDKGGGIGDVRLYLNGSAVLLDSVRGLKVISTSQYVRKTYALKLVNGTNTIRALAFNADNTMQGNAAIHEITASFKTGVKPSLHALVIGINDYKNPRLQLNHAVADAMLFADTLKEGALSLFEKVEVKVLTSTEGTTNDNIINEIKMMHSLNPDDLFVFYVASHGTVDNGEYYLITSNVGSTRTERLKTDAIGQSVFKKLISNIPATKKLIIIDTCNAGALGEAIQMAMLTRGMSEDAAMKILSRAVGSTILSASTSMQEALEGYQGHGLFTYVLSEGLKGKADKGRTGYVRTTELADYVDNEVPALAEKVFRKAQYPTISISGQAFPIGKAKP